MKFKMVQNVCCRVLHYVRFEKWIYKGLLQKKYYMLNEYFSVYFCKGLQTCVVIKENFRLANE